VHRLDEQLRQAWFRERAMMQGGLPAERVFALHPAGKVMQDLHGTLGHDMAAALAQALQATHQTKAADNGSAPSHSTSARHSVHAGQDASIHRNRDTGRDTSSNRDTGHDASVHRNMDTGRDANSGGDTGRDDGNRRDARHRTNDLASKKEDTARLGNARGTPASTEAPIASHKSAPHDPLLKPGMDHTLLAHMSVSLISPQLLPVPPQIEIRVDVVGCRNLSVPASIGGGLLPPGESAWVCSVIMGRKKHSTGVARGVAPRFDKSFMFLAPADSNRSIISVTVFCRSREGKDTAIGAAMIPVGLVRESPNSIIEGWYTLTAPGAAPNHRSPTPPAGAPLVSVPCVRVLAKILASPP